MYDPVLGDRPRLNEKSESHLGEQPEGGGDALCRADGIAHGILLHLESEPAQTQTEGCYQAQEYEALLNIKVKLETETTTAFWKKGRTSILVTPWTTTPCNPSKTTTTSRIVDSKQLNEVDVKFLRH